MEDFKHFINLLEKTSSRAELEDLLIGITTAKERKEISQRLEIIKRLIAGDAQHKIAKDIGVGVATVTRGSKELQEGRFKVLRSNNE